VIRVCPLVSSGSSVALSSTPLGRLSLDNVLDRIDPIIRGEVLDTCAGDSDGVTDLVVSLCDLDGPLHELSSSSPPSSAPSLVLVLLDHINTV
jgi:hypothetical protein